METVKNALSCNKCDFVGKSEVGLTKHDKSKHGQNNKITTKPTSDIIQKQDESDEFTNKINDFLKSMNHLNKPQNDYSF